MFNTYTLRHLIVIVFWYCTQNLVFHLITTTKKRKASFKYCISYVGQWQVGKNPKGAVQITMCKMRNLHSIYSLHVNELLCGSIRYSNLLIIERERTSTQIVICKTLQL